MNISFDVIAKLRPLDKIWTILWMHSENTEIFKTESSDGRNNIAIITPINSPSTDA